MKKHDLDLIILKIVALNVENIIDTIEVKDYAQNVEEFNYYKKELFKLVFFL